MMSRTVAIGIQDFRELIRQGETQIFVLGLILES